MAGEAQREPYAYALLRVVPSLPRGEALNVAVVLFARRHGGFLGMRSAVDEQRLHALDPSLDVAAIREHLDRVDRVLSGDPAAGRVAGLDPSDRFGWVTAPASTIVQPGPVHTGLCDDPQARLDRLFQTLVALP